MALLDLLKRFNARATFFLVGDKAQQFPEVARSIVSAGHRIGNHSFSHPRWRSIPATARDTELAQTEELLRSFDGRHAHSFRPPRGHVPVSSALACIFGHDSITLWSRDSYDYKLAAEMVVESLRSPEVVSGDIILFHDDQPVAETALAELLPAWSALGFAFEALPE